MAKRSIKETLAPCSELGRHNEDWRTAEIICGGFPCQDISHAGKRAGITASRSGLWAYLCGTICLVRPLYAIVENVAALLREGMDTVCGDLAISGYDTEWYSIPAAAVGLSQLRDRVWIIAYPESESRACTKPRFWRYIADCLMSAERHKKPEWDMATPELCRLVDGVPDRVGRLKGSGNAVVPQIPEIIGEAINKYEQGFIRQ